MHFTLLSCISQARAGGITQSEAAKQTGQDPRSFPGRTKLLVEYGLMYLRSPVYGADIRIKQPILMNGNQTYRLTHTRFRTTGNATPQAGLFSGQHPHITAQKPIEETIEEVVPETSTTVRGLSRDMTFGTQIIEALEELDWDRKVRFSWGAADIRDSVQGC